MYTFQDKNELLVKSAHAGYVDVCRLLLTRGNADANHKNKRVGKCIDTNFWSGIMHDRDISRVIISGYHHGLDIMINIGQRTR